jgi:signal transduction histidine kinase
MKDLFKNKKHFRIYAKFIILIGIIFLSNTLHAQFSLRDQKKIDSLERVLNTPNLPDDEFLIVCEKLHVVYINIGESRKSLEYVWKGLRLAEKKMDYYQLAIFYFSAGGAYYQLAQHDSALYYFEKAIPMEEKAKKKGLTGDEDFEFLNMQIFQLLGSLHGELGNYELALDNCFKALKMVKEMDIPYIEAITLSNIANIHARMQLVHKEEEYLLKAQKIFREIDDPLQLADNYSKLSGIYTYAGDHKKALELAEEAYRILIAVPDMMAHYLIGTTKSLTHIWLKFPDYNKALKYALQSVEYAKEIETPKETASAYNLLATCYLFLKRYKEAEETAFLALKADSSDVNRNLISYQTIAESNLWLKNSEKALEYFRKVFKTQDDYSNQTYLASISEMDVKYETEKKENEITRQQNIIARHNLYRALMAGGLAIGAIILALLWYLLRMRKQHNQLLTEINATKDKFFNIISHDLKNPAIAQRDAIKQLEKNLNLWSEDELANFCRNLLKSADEEVELLHTLLSWAQIQTGRMSYEPITFDLSTQLRNDISLIKKMAEFKKITLINNTPKHAQVTGDKNMIVTVVRNLLTNAVKFTPVGGEISLTIETTPNGKVKVSVCDTGTGMPPEQISNLFNLDCLRSSKGTIGEQGNGLGLIVCKELLQKHNSTLFVKSEEGKGSRFWFEI